MKYREKNTINVEHEKQLLVFMKSDKSFELQIREKKQFRVQFYLEFCHPASKEEYF